MSQTSVLNVNDSMQRNSKLIQNSKGTANSSLDGLKVDVSRSFDSQGEKLFKMRQCSDNKLTTEEQN